MFADHNGVGGFMIIGKRLSMYDCEFPFRCCFEEKFLHCGGRGMREDNLVRVDVLKGIAGDLFVNLVEFVNYFLNTLNDFRAEVFGGVEVLEGVRSEGMPWVW